MLNGLRWCEFKKSPIGKNWFFGCGSGLFFEMLKMVSETVDGTSIHVGVLWIQFGSVFGLNIRRELVWWRKTPTSVRRDLFMDPDGIYTGTNIRCSGRVCLGYAEKWPTFGWRIRVGSDTVVKTWVFLGVPTRSWTSICVGSDWDRSSRVQKTDIVSCGLSWCSPKISWRCIAVRIRVGSVSCWASLFPVWKFLGFFLTRIDFFRIFASWIKT